MALKALKFNLSFLLIFSPFFLCLGQNDSLYDHKQYVGHIQNSQEEYYLAVLKQYDEWINSYPDNAELWIEKCKFVEQAFYNDEYNPKQDDLDSLLELLYEKYPSNPAVLIYKSNFLWGDSALAFLLRTKKDIEIHNEIWKDYPVWIIYEKLASQYSYKDNDKLGIYYGEKAMKMNDTLDLGLILAPLYEKAGQKDKAVEILLENIDPNDPGYDLNAKAEILLRLEKYNDAIRVFGYAQKDSANTYVNFLSLSSSLEKVGKIKEARLFLRKASQEAFNNKEAIEQLFLFDLSHSTMDTALTSYNTLRDQGFSFDPFSYYRLSLFINHPLLPWEWRDFIGVLLLILLLTCAIIIPLFWILPVHYAGFLLKRKRTIQPLHAFRWTLKDCWKICALVLLADIISMLIFEYKAFILLFQNDGFHQNSLVISEASHANALIVFSLSSLVCTLFFLKRKDSPFFWGNEWDRTKVIVFGLLAVLFIKIVAVTCPLPSQWFEMGYLSSVIQEKIIATMHTYGALVVFLIVVILVPFYEEIIFRGIILSSCEKHINFMYANILQSFLFMLVHPDYRMMIFYFATGMMAGLLRQKSGGLGASFFMHSANNFLAFLYYLLKFGEA